MTAKIDIRTPAGKSLEGFPRPLHYGHLSLVPKNNNTYELYVFNSESVTLHKGDIITIEVL